MKQNQDLKGCKGTFETADGIRDFGGFVEICRIWK